LLMLVLVLLVLALLGCCFAWFGAVANNSQP
jgi:hypothetical protein